MRTDNAGDLWTNISGNLPTDFGFPIEVHAHEPDTVYVFRSRAMQSIMCPTENCESFAVAPVAWNGNRSVRACRKRIAL